MRKITKQTLHISNLPKLFEDNWFEKHGKMDPEEQKQQKDNIELALDVLLL